jgi:acylphosphatase
MTKSLQCLVSGKVQGVNFRAWVKGQAEQLGVKGWVRNLDDGRVEVLAQGSEDALQALKGKIAAGSTMSRVDNVETKWIDYDKQHTGFELRL